MKRRGESEGERGKIMKLCTVEGKTKEPLRKMCKREGKSNAR